MSAQILQAYADRIAHLAVELQAVRTALAAERQRTARLRKQLRLATDALEYIVEAECAACEITFVEDALTQMSVVDDDDERARQAEARGAEGEG